MTLPHNNAKSPGSYLAVQDSVLNSPGSSVFDLPVQYPNQTSNESKPANIDTGLNTQARNNQLDDFASPSFLVISGGTGGNAICSAFDEACYVLPVSDDGGSSSEIIRVLGGPSIGDIRSRLVRLIPPAPPASPLGAIRTLLAYRLPSRCTEPEARDKWRDIIEGKSPRWTGIPNDRKETIRGFLIYFESEVLKRAHKNFSFRNGSIGNYFLAAAQGFFRSLPSAIFLFSSITNSKANILPVIVTNHTVTIAAELVNGKKLIGQCEISHPVQSPISINVESMSPLDGMGVASFQPLNALFEQQSKDDWAALPSPISRLYYMNAYGHEVHPSPNPDYISSIALKDVLVYSCGSLWTSIMPCLALRGVAQAIARSGSLRAKVLLLNSVNDRETNGYTAVDYINAITGTLNAPYSIQHYGLSGASTTYPTSALITHLVYLKETNILVDIQHITKLGVKCVEVEAHSSTGNVPIASVPKLDADRVRGAIRKLMSE